jgi:uncharacterized membrane protein
MSVLIALIFDEEGEVVVEAMRDPVATPSGAVVGFPAGSVVEEDPEIAKGVLKNILAKAKEADVKLEDAVILHRAANGQVKIKQTKEVTAGKGAKRGAFWGLLAGLLLGGPIGGLLWGLGIGAVYGAVSDHGIDDKFLKGVSKGLTRKKSAVLILVKDEDAERAVAYLRTFDADMHVTDLSKETEEAADKAAENEEIAQAVEAEFGTS